MRRARPRHERAREPDRRRPADGARPARRRLRLGRLRRALPRARARQLREGRRRVAHDPADRDGRAGRDRPRRLPRARRALARAAVRRAAPGAPRGSAGRRRGRARRARRRVLRAHPAHARVRRLPRGPALVGAAGDRGRAARAPARGRRRRRAGDRARSWRRRGRDARPPRVRADAARARAPAVRRARAHHDRAARWSPSPPLVVAVAARAPARGPHQRGRAPRRRRPSRCSTATTCFARSSAAGRRARAARGPARPPGGHDHGPAARAARARGRRGPRAAPDLRLRPHPRARRASSTTSSCAPSTARACNDAPGYEVRFRTGPPGRYTFGSDLMLLPERGADGGRAAGQPAARDHGAARSSARARRSSPTSRPRRCARCASARGRSERPPRPAGAPILGTGRLRDAPPVVPVLASLSVRSLQTARSAVLRTVSRHTA